MQLTPGNAVSAIIQFDDGSYLLQLRDDKPDIWFPNHWGLFGGAIDEGETPEQALVRELNEELGINIDPSEIKYFTRYDFDFGYAGHGSVCRIFYEINMDASRMNDMTLGEGADMKAFTPSQITDGLKITPYDSFALWMHINSST